MARGGHVFRSCKICNKLLLSLKKHARHLTGDTGSTGRYISMWERQWTIFTSNAKYEDTLHPHASKQSVHLPNYILSHTNLCEKCIIETLPDLRDNHIAYTEKLFIKPQRLFWAHNRPSSRQQQQSVSQQEKHQGCLSASPRLVQSHPDSACKLDFIKGALYATCMYAHNAGTCMHCIRFEIASSKQMPGLCKTLGFQQVPFSFVKQIWLSPTASAVALIRVVAIY